MTSVSGDAWEIGEPAAEVEARGYPMEERRKLDQYADLVRLHRAELVDDRIDDMVEQIDQVLAATQSIENRRGRIFGRSDSWGDLRHLNLELFTLLGESVSVPRRGDLARHLHFGEPHDLADIVEVDWPAVREGVLKRPNAHGTFNVDVDDLGQLANSSLGGPARKQLDWTSIDDHQFEGLVYDILSSSPSYENVEWLTKPNAPDRGRDLSAERVSEDELSGTQRKSLFIQCKHWTSKSINMEEALKCAEATKLWTRKFDIVIVVTAGSFTADAVEWREQRAAHNEAPAVEYWPGSHIETILASKPTIRSTYFPSA